MTRHVPEPTEPTPDESRPAGPVRLVKFLTRLCLACGRVESEPDGKTRRWPENTIFHGNRCDYCGARALIVDEPEVVRIRDEGHADFSAILPRRGRPPKWLIDKRTTGAAWQESAAS